MLIRIEAEQHRGQPQRIAVGSRSTSSSRSATRGLGAVVPVERQAPVALDVELGKLGNQCARLHRVAARTVVDESQHPTKVELLPNRISGLREACSSASANTEGP